MTKNEERLKNELTRTRLELEHYKGFYIGVNTILNFIKDDEIIKNTTSEARGRQMQYLVKKLNEREEK